MDTWSNSRCEIYSQIKGMDHPIASYATQAKKSWFPLIGIQSCKTTHLRISEFLSLTLSPLGPGRPSGPWKPYKIDKGECQSPNFSRELFFVSSSRIDCCLILKRISFGPSWILRKYGLWLCKLLMYWLLLDFETNIIWPQLNSKEVWFWRWSSSELLKTWHTCL